MLIGKPPYETPDVKTTYKKIKMNNYSFPVLFIFFFLKKTITIRKSLYLFIYLFFLRKIFKFQKTHEI